MVDRQEMRMQSMQQGREASVIASLVGPYLNDKVSLIVSRMAASYRSQQADYTSLLGSVAQITLCLDIMADLESRVRRADQAAKEELDGSAKSSK